jgi:hypothetical protein
MLGRLIAIFTFSRRTDYLTSPAEVIDGDTIVVADQLVRLHGIDAPELDQTFWWRGQQMACGTMSLAALEALIAGVKVRCEVIEEGRHGRLVAKVFSPQWDRHRPQVGVGGVGPGVPAVLKGLRGRRERGPEGQARDVAGNLRQALGMARIITVAARAGTVNYSLGLRPAAVSSA